LLNQNRSRGPRDAALGGHAIETGHQRTASPLQVCCGVGPRPTGRGPFFSANPFRAELRAGRARSALFAQRITLPAQQRTRLAEGLRARSLFSSVLLTAAVA